MSKEINRAADAAKSENAIGGNAAALLANYKDQISSLFDERDAINESVKNVLAEAKSNGFSGPAIRKLVSAARTDQQKRLEKEMLERVYMRATGVAVAE